jgi:chemotaxis protein MotB
MKPIVMKHAISFIMISGILLGSCVSKKKLEDANQQIATLHSRIDSLAKVNQDCRQSVAQLKTENAKISTESADCIKARQAFRDRVEAFNQTLEQNGNSMEKIKAKIAKSLDAFKDAGITTRYKNGLVYISMQDQLMFPSGSAKLDDPGRQALSVIADALAEYQHLTVYVVGNTDSVKVVKGFTDNWSLSTERANTIVRVLRDYYGADPSRIVSAGRGKYDPIGDNSTKEGRALNRRTDIILNPDLSRLWGMMVKDSQ